MRRRYRIEDNGLLKVPAARRGRLLPRRRAVPAHSTEDALLCTEHGVPVKRDAFGNVVGLCPRCVASHG